MMESDSGSEEESEVSQSGLMISKEAADKNYELAGMLVDEAPDEISIAKHEELLSDTTHVLIMEVLAEAQISFNLSDFQMLSLHTLGSKKHLVLISPTGSGKMLGKKI